MVGWLISDNGNRFGEFERSIEVDGLFFGYTSNGQYLQDKVFTETEKHIICLDGIILNKSKIYNELDWKDAIESLFKNDRTFPASLRGSFNGFIYEKSTKKLTVFVDHLGERAVFYSTISNRCLISSNFNIINEIYKKESLNRDLNIDAVKYMLSFGYMLEDCTYIQSVKRMMPGTKLYFQKGNENTSTITIEQYHIFTNQNVVTDEDDVIIRTLDQLFRNAITMAFEKDKEYNKRTLVDLSGGLDCRVINYVAKDLGYSDQINVSFSQVGSDEYKVMMMLSKDLKNDLIFFPLDNANYLKDLEKIVEWNYGLTLYSTTTGVSSIINYINFNNIGIELGGLLGEMHDGAMPGEYYVKHEPASFEKGMRFSKIVPNEALNKEILAQYENNEIFTVIGRGLLAGYGTVIMRNHVSEFWSPFADVDFYDFFLSIPLQKRVKEKIMQKWIAAYYPQAFAIVHDKTMCRIQANRVHVETKMFFKKVMFKIKTFFRIPIKNNMNPFEYWYKTDDTVREFIDNYYANNKKIVSNYHNIDTYMERMFDAGNVRDKTMVLTALAAIKMYCDEA